MFLLRRNLADVKTEQRTWRTLISLSMLRHVCGFRLTLNATPLFTCPRFIVFGIQTISVRREFLMIRMASIYEFLLPRQSLQTYS